MGKIDFLNIKVDNLTMDQAIDKIEQLVIPKGCSYVVTPNVDHIVRVEDDEEFKKVYDDADLVLTDGMPLIWISRYLHNPIVEKVSGSDLLPRVCEMAAKKGFRVYILGAAEGVAEKAAENLVHTYPGLKIVGTCSPSYGFEKNNDEICKIIQKVNNAQPDILAVSLGSPKGEKFIYKYLDQLNVPLSMQIGAAVDFLAGNVKRAPKWMSNCGLEWLYRTIMEPKRLAKRYYHDAIKIGPIIKKYKKVNKKGVGVQ